MPPIAIREVDTWKNVTLEELDWRKDYVVVVYAGLGFSFLDATMQNPPSATALFLTGPFSVRPPLVETPIDVTPNYLVYLMKFDGGSISGPGSSRIDLATGLLKRSDTTVNRPTSFLVKFGFVPDVFLIDSRGEIDAEFVGGAPAWFSPRNVSSSQLNATVTLRVTCPTASLSDINVTDWITRGYFYSSDDGVPYARALPGGLRVVNDFASVNRDAAGNYFDIKFSIEGIPPGQYPISIRHGLIPSYITTGVASGQMVNNARITAWLKIGLTPSWHMFDGVTGADISGDVIAPTRSVLFALVLDGEHNVSFVNAFAAAAEAGNTNALPLWENLVTTQTMNDIPLTSAPRASYAYDFSVLYALADLVSSPLAAANYTIATAASGLVCNGLQGRAQLCATRELEPLKLQVGFVPFVSVWDGTQTNQYFGALDADGVGFASAANKAVPCLAPTIALVFTDDLSGAGSINGGLAPEWADAVSATPSLPAPTAITRTDGSIIFEWGATDAAAIQSGTYDVELRQGLFAGSNAVKNARAIVRIVVGLDVAVMNAATTIMASGADTPASGRIYERGRSRVFVTSVSDIVIRVLGMQETGFVWNELVNTVTLRPTVEGALAQPISKTLLADLDAARGGAWGVQDVNGLRVDFPAKLSGLNDGQYDITLRNSETGDLNYDETLYRDVVIHDAYGYELGSRVVAFSIVVLRAPPIGAGATFSPSEGGRAFAAGRPSGVVPVSAAAFSTSPLQPPTRVRLSLDSRETRGFSLLRKGLPDFAPIDVVFENDDAVRVPLDAALLTTGPRRVHGPAGPISLSVRAEDEAGNVGFAALTATVVNPPVPTLIASDTRGQVNRTVLIIAPTDGAIMLTLYALYSSPVMGATATSVFCTVGKSICSDFVVTGFREEVSSAAYGVSAYAWEIRIGGYDVVRTTDQLALSINLTVLPTGVVDYVTRVEAELSSTLSVRVDASSPKPPFTLVNEQPDGYLGAWVPPIAGVVGVEYYATLPYSLFDDDFSPSRLGGVTVAASPPAAPYGLQFVAGVLGRAYLRGAPASAVLNNRILYTVTATDVAGNSIRVPSVVSVVVLDSMPKGVPRLSLSAAAARADMTFRKGGAPVFLDSRISFKWDAPLNTGDAIEGVYVRLHSPEATVNVSGSSGVDGAEFLTAENVCVPTTSELIPPCLVSYTVDELTGDGVLALLPSVRETWINGLRDTHTIGNVTLGNVEQFLRSVKYANTRRNIFVDGKRLLYVQVMQTSPGLTSAPLPPNQDTPNAEKLHVAVATAARSVYVVGFNDPPAVVFNATNNPLIQWAQQNPAPVPIFDAVDDLVDKDDEMFTSATVKILLGAATAGAPFASCDTARDRLELLSSYTGAEDQPLAMATWLKMSCTLLVTPIPPLKTISRSDLIRALHAITYFNVDSRNPLGWTNGTTLVARRRFIEVVVTDAGSMGTRAPVSSATGVGVTLVITPADEPYAVDRRVAFAKPLGLLSSTDTNALSHSFADARGVIRQTKWPLVIPKAGSPKALVGGAITVAGPRSNCSTTAPLAEGGAVMCTIAIDLSPVDGARGVFGGGAFSSPNRLAPPESVKIRFLAGSTYAAGALTDGVEYELSDCASSARLGATFLPQSTFSYSPDIVSMLTLYLRGDASEFGEFMLELDWSGEPGPVKVQFAVDVRVTGCVLEDSPDYAGIADVKLGLIYPDNVLCTFPPTLVTAADGATVTRGGYAASAASMANALTSMNELGVSAADQFTALTALRDAARGNFAVDILPGALTGAGSIPLSADFVSDALRAQLQSSVALPTTQANARVDYTLSIELGPAGSTFSPPFRACIFVGSVDPSEGASLVISSRLVADDPTKGYGPFTFMADASFIRATGRVCGSADHFSVVAPLLSPLPEPPLELTGHRMGGACPVDGARRECSANGYCRAGGSCACFPGFTGTDCSLRTCAAGESWGQTDYFSEAVAHVPTKTASGPHDVVECSGRGVCNRKSGLCSCFNGFEGANCGRMGCPRKAVNTTNMFVYTMADQGAAAARLELEWEAAFTPADEALLSGGAETAEQACSGRGKCRPLGDLPAVARAGVSDWALTRVHKCVCDAGFSGPDCSERSCPHGNDRYGGLRGACNPSACAATAACVGCSAAVKLSCPFGYAFASIDFASYGLPSGSCAAGWAASASYHSTESKSVAEARCLGKSSCSLSTLDPLFTYDPAPNEWKIFAVKGSCIRMSGDGETFGPSGDGKQVQRVTLDFGQYPTTLGVISVDSPEVAFKVSTSYRGVTSETTTAITGVWAGDAAAAARVQAALRRMPGLGARDVTVSHVESTEPTSLSVSYDVTFTEGGAQPLLECLTNADGTMGCVSPGCQPKVAQMALLDSSALPSSITRVSSVLFQPPPVAGSANDATTFGVWGVSTTLQIDIAAPGNAADAATRGALSYVWTSTTIYGVPIGDDELAHADWAWQTTPLPPNGLRDAIVGPYGLRVSLGDNSALGADLGTLISRGQSAPWSFKWSWRLPSCGVVVGS